MGKLLFPTIGSQVRLTADWQFRLFAEHRNAALFRAMRLFKTAPDANRYSYYNTHLYDVDVRATHAGPGHKLVALPAQTVLQIDRIYIRKGNEDYDSLTFFIVDSPNRYLLAWRKHNGKTTFGGGVRFWAKLEDFNGVAEGEWLADPVPFVCEPANKALHT